MCLCDLEAQISSGLSVSEEESRLSTTHIFISNPHSHPITPNPPLLIFSKQPQGKLVSIPQTRISFSVQSTPFKLQIPKHKSPPILRQFPYSIFQAPPLDPTNSPHYIFKPFIHVRARSMQVALHEQHVVRHCCYRVGKGGGRGVGGGGVGEVYSGAEGKVY